MELLSSYSITELIGIVIALALMTKGFVEFFSWCKKKWDVVFEKAYQKKHKEESNDITLSSLKHSQDVLQQEMKEIRESLHILMKSDMDDIKSYITERHHFFCYVQKWIDDYSLECLEKRYGHYVKEGGNSFIGGFMQELRGLPKQQSSASGTIL